MLHLTLRLEHIQGSIAIYPPYHHLTFILHTSLRKSLPWLALESCIGWILIKPKCICFYKCNIFPPLKFLQDKFLLIARRADVFLYEIRDFLTIVVLMTLALDSNLTLTYNKMKIFPEIRRGTCFWKSQSGHSKQQDKKKMREAR